MFFYCLVFDPMQKTLLADKGEIRVGSKYQADITPLLNSGMKCDHKSIICFIFLRSKDIDGIGFLL